MRYTVILERGESGWGAQVPDLPGCFAAGASRDEAVALIREAIEAHMQDLKQQGLPIPAPCSEGEVVEVGAA